MQHVQLTKLSGVAGRGWPSWRSREESQQLFREKLSPHYQHVFRQLIEAPLNTCCDAVSPWLVPPDVIHPSRRQPITTGCCIKTCTPCGNTKHPVIMQSSRCVLQCKTGAWCWLLPVVITIRIMILISTLEELAILRFQLSNGFVFFVSFYLGFVCGHDA